MIFTLTYFCLCVKTILLNSGFWIYTFLMLSLFPRFFFVFFFSNLFHNVLFWFCAHLFVLHPSSPPSHFFLNLIVDDEVRRFSNIIWSYTNKKNVCIIIIIQPITVIVYTGAFFSFWKIRFNTNNFIFVQSNGLCSFWSVEVQRDTILRTTPRHWWMVEDSVAIYNFSSTVSSGNILRVSGPHPLPPSIFTNFKFLPCS